MIILSTQERKYETKTFNKNFAKKVRICRLPFPQRRSLNSLIINHEIKELIAIGLAAIQISPCLIQDKS
jgi:protoheme ferro-lyase